MPLLEIQGLGDDQVRRGLSTVNSFSEKIAYRPAYPVQMVPAGTASWARHTIGVPIDVAAISMPDATARIVGSFPVPPDWVTGQVELEILYTGDVSSTANISIGVSLTGAAIGAAIPAGVIAPAHNIPGPATAGFLLTFTTSLAAVVTAAHRIVSFKISQGANVYAGIPYIIGVYPIWYPRKQ